jgi:hypothetical protein
MAYEELLINCHHRRALVIEQHDTNKVEVRNKITTGMYDLN